MRQRHAVASRGSVTRKRRAEAARGSGARKRRAEAARVLCESRKLQAGFHGACYCCADFCRTTFCRACQTQLSADNLFPWTQTIGAFLVIHARTFSTQTNKQNGCFQNAFVVEAYVRTWKSWTSKTRYLFPL